MPDIRRWYTEPETFVAVAALIVSLSALGVGVYEAKLQRRHDRAEVWPHLEIEVFVGDSGANVQVENTGLGPAVVESISVDLDGKPQHNWRGILQAFADDSTRNYSNNTIFEHGIRPGDHVTLLGLPREALPTPFWNQVGRVVVTVCYRSVFDEISMVSDTLGKADHWTQPSKCPAQVPTADF